VVGRRYCRTAAAIRPGEQRQVNGANPQRDRFVRVRVDGDRDRDGESARFEDALGRRDEVMRASVSATVNARASNRRGAFGSY